MEKKDGGTEGCAWRRKDELKIQRRGKDGEGEQEIP